MSISRRLAFAALVAGTAVPPAANAGTFTTLYSFTGKADGQGPYGPLIYYGGELVGLTTGNIFTGLGNMFKVNSSTGRFDVVYAFQGGADGAVPTAMVNQGGIFYGTTSQGGGSGCVIDNRVYGGGTIFSVNEKTGAEAVLYAFPGCTNPGGLVYLQGIIYGVTQNGGANSDGSVFSFNPATSSFNTLYSFTEATGVAPNLQLLYQNGLLYGATEAGGNCFFCGVVFSIDPTTGTETTVHAFGPAHGRSVHSNLVYQAGSLIGDTYGGGNHACQGGCGVSFKIKVATGHEKILETFATSAENYSGQIIVGGSVYETIPSGGNGYGELLQVDLKSGQQTVLYTFTGGSDGSNPVAPLLYHDGAFYGTTDGGYGTVFKFVP